MISVLADFPACIVWGLKLTWDLSFFILWRKHVWWNLAEIRFKMSHDCSFHNNENFIANPDEGWCWIKLNKFTGGNFTDCLCADAVLCVKRWTDFSNRENVKANLFLSACLNVFSQVQMTWYRVNLTLKVYLIWIVTKYSQLVFSN